MRTSKTADAYPNYAHVVLLDGCKSIVSNSDLALCRGTENERQKVFGDVDPSTESIDSSTDSSSNSLIHKRYDSSPGRFDAETLTDKEQLTEDNSKTSLSPTKSNLTNSPKPASNVPLEEDVVLRRSEKFRKLPDRYGKCVYKF